jgi:putative endonuclease
MAGLVPAIPIRKTPRMRQYYVYILASRPGGALYVGVTNDLIRRVYEHRNKLADGHTKHYQINRLVYYEAYDTAYRAIQREKRISSIGRAFGKHASSPRRMIRGGICTMKLHSHNPMIEIAGTSPAMT